MSKELLFSITKDVCRWDYYRGFRKKVEKEMRNNIKVEIVENGIWVKEKERNK